MQSIRRLNLQRCFRVQLELNRSAGINSLEPAASCTRLSKFQKRILSENKSHYRRMAAWLPGQLVDTALLAKIDINSLHSTLKLIIFD